MDRKQYLINKINDRLQAAIQEQTQTRTHNKRFADEILNLLTKIEEGLVGIPAVTATRNPLTTTGSETFKKFSISLFDKSVDLTSVEEDGRLALKLESFGYKPMIFKLAQDGQWEHRQPGNHVFLTNNLIHERLTKIVDF